MRLFTVSFLLSLTSTTMTVVYGQANTTCSSWKPTDSACGFMSPLETLFYEGQANALSDSYLGQLQILCPGFSKNPSTKDVFPFVFCLGSMGPCNGASFKLPEVDDQGRPKNIMDVGTFYNQAKFSELLPAIEKAGLVPPCYESCKAASDAVVTCPALSKVISSTSDPCVGLPKYSEGAKCIQKPGPSLNWGNTDSTPSSSPTSGKDKSSDSKTNNAMKHNNIYTQTILLLSMSSAALLMIL